MKKFIKSMTTIEIVILGTIVLLVVLFTTSTITLFNSIESSDTSIMEELGEGVRNLTDEFNKGYEK